MKKNLKDPQGRPLNLITQQENAMSETINITIKGRVGKFEYGYVSSQNWLVRNRETLEVYGYARHLNGAFTLARRAHDEEKEGIQWEI